MGVYAGRPRDDPWARLEAEIVRCRACPRLVAHREKVAREKTRRFAPETYWGRPVPGFGDRQARLLVVGLAPAAHGANRTGRMFTGDRSGDWLYEALHAFGFATCPQSRSRDDHLRLRGAFVTAIVRCAPPANRPAPQEIARCRPFLQQELRLLAGVRAVVALGHLAFAGYLRAREETGLSLPSPRPKFAHGAEIALGDVVLLCSYHPSQQNTFTRRLTRPMFHAVFRRAREVVDRA